MQDMSEVEKKGEEGEKAMNEWLKDNKLCYVYVKQSPDTFAPLFEGAVKRPDFLVLFESISLLAVDVKNYGLLSEWNIYTLKVESELNRALAFERLFRLPVWYAYMKDPQTWYWISALKAAEVGKIRENQGTNENFLAIKLEHFAEVKSNADLGKLYTQRLGSAKQFANM